MSVGLPAGGYTSQSYVGTRVYSYKYTDADAAASQNTSPASNPGLTFYCLR